MSPLEAAIETVRRVAAKLGVTEFSRISGVPLVTLYDCKKRDFLGGTVETLQKLVDAAEAFERDAERQDAAA